MSLPFVCSVDKCTFSTRNKQSLNNHFKRLHTDRKYSCERCQRTFIFQSELNDHIKLHNNASLKECELCGKNFRSRAGLKHHYISDHGLQGNYRCNIQGCNRTFDRKDKFQEHENRHLNIKNFCCTSCHQRFSTKAALYYHMMRCSNRDNNLMYLCKICHKTFSTIMDLKQHHFKHVAQYFDCEKCRKSFKFQSGLSRHKKFCKI